MYRLTKIHSFIKKFVKQSFKIYYQALWPQSGQRRT